MEPMSGKELFEEMNRDKAIGNVPIILITGTAGKGTAWLAGAAAYLRKPFHTTKHWRRNWPSWESSRMK